MYVLDTAAVRRALRDLQKRIAAVERLMQQLNVKDDAEVYNFRSHQSRTIKEYRLVSLTVADALSVAYPWEKLFIPWNEWLERRKTIRKIALKNKQVRDLKPPLSSDAISRGES
jgi:hypothetical protein